MDKNQDGKGHCELRCVAMIKRIYWKNSIKIKIKYEILKTKYFFQVDSRSKQNGL